MKWPCPKCGTEYSPLDLEKDKIRCRKCNTTFKPPLAHTPMPDVLTVTPPPNLSHTHIESQILRVDGTQLAVMLLITWLTCFVGLGNLIFLWSDLRYRRRAAIALGLTLGTAFIILILLFSIIGIVLILFAIWIPLGMAIWMTIDAISVYKKSKILSEIENL
jgi:hypothetical protein